MSASQQKRNKDLHKYIDWLEAEVNRLREERNGKAEGSTKDKVKHLLLENAALRELIEGLKRKGLS